MKTRYDILSISDNSRKQSYNSLTNLSKQLQDGSIIKGIVTGITDEGEVIFTTTHGKFALSAASLNMSKGDEIELQIFRNNSNIEAVITAVNGFKSLTSEPMSLTSVSSLRNNAAAAPAPAESYANNTGVFINNAAAPTKAFTATVTYVNLAHMTPSSPLREALTGINNNTQIHAKIVTTDGIKDLSPYQFKAIVVSNDELTHSVKLKTPWGIISTADNQLSEVRVGQQLQLALTQIDQKPIMETNIESLVVALLSKINETHKELAELTKLTSNSHNNGDNLIHHNPEEERRLQQSNIRTLTNSDHKLLFNELSEKLNSLQQILASSNLIDKNLQWIPLPIRIFDGETLHKNKVFIKRTNNIRNIAFIIDLSLEHFGELQLQGNITLAEDKEVDNFQLIFRYISLEEGMQRHIASLFSIYQDISHGRGSIAFEQVKGFSSKS